MIKKNVKYTFTFPLDLREKVEIMAEKEERTLPAQLRVIIERAVQKCR